MLKKLIRLKKLYITVVITLLVGAMFFSYYSVNDTMEILKNSFNSENNKAVSSEALAKARGSTNKLKFTNNKLADTEKEKIISKKTIADTYYNSFSKRWMFCYLYIFIILLAYLFILYIKGWFIKLSHPRFQFYQAHYIQLKDGKKDALSYPYSVQ